MTQMLEEAVNRVKKLPNSKQDRIAALILKQLQDDKGRRGKPGRDLLPLAGTMSTEEAAEMTRIIEEEFERIDPDGW